MSTTDAPSDDSARPEDAEDTPSAQPETTARAGRSVREIALDLWRPKPRASDPGATPASQKQIVDGLDPRERMIGIVAAVASIVITLVGYFFHFRHSANATLRADAPVYLVAGLIGFALLVLGVSFQRRALLGFAAFIAGFEMITSVGTVGILYIAFGGWLITRALRKQKQQPPQRRAVAHMPTPTKTTPKKSKRYTPPRKSRASSGRKR